MNLYFQNRHGKKTKIAEVRDEKAALKEIRKYCSDRNFTIYYIRQWCKNNYKIFDVGSHTEYFLLELEKEVSV